MLGVLDMSDPKPEDLRYRLVMTQSQVNEAVTDWLKKHGKIPNDDCAEAAVQFYADDGYGHSIGSWIDVQAQISVHVHDSAALVNILKDDAEED